MSQLLLIIAIVLYAITFLLKTKRKILLISLFVILLNIISFILLGAYTGAIINLVALTRSIWFFIEEAKGQQTRLSLVIIIFLMMIATFYNYQNWIDLLPFISSIIYTFACWQKSVKLYNWLGILVGLIDILYDIQFNSIVGIISRLFAISCAVIGIIMTNTNKKSV